MRIICFFNFSIDVIFGFYIIYFFKALIISIYFKDLTELSFTTSVNDKILFNFSYPNINLIMWTIMSNSNLMFREVQTFIAIFDFILL